MQNDAQTLEKKFAFIYNVIVRENSGIFFFQDYRFFLVKHAAEPQFMEDYKPRRNDQSRLARS